jgi:molecular chaperone IbpA
MEINRYGNEHPRNHWESIDPYKKKIKEQIDWTPPAPKPITVETLFPNLGRWSIGFDPVFDTLKALAKDKAASYPPYNVTKNGETYMIDVALAGFSKDEIDVTVVDQTLTISTAADAKIPTESQIKKSGTETLYQGIAKRAFKLNFAISEYVEVTQATMKDGILLVVCENKLPEALLPKKIAIK